MATAEKAENAREIYEKYKSKKFRVENAGLIVILEYTYQLYLLDSDDESAPKHLYSEERIDQVRTRMLESRDERSIWLYSGMESLMQWLPTARDSAVAACSSAVMSILNATSTLQTLSFAGKRVSAFYNDTRSIDDKSKTEIQKDFEAHEDALEKQFNDTREYIENILCYIHAYNALISCTTETLKIPEFIGFGVDTGAVEEMLDTLNEQINKYKASEEAARHENTMNLSPIKLIPAPIPEENKKNSMAATNRAMYHGGAWSTALTEMTDGYWRRTLGNG